MCGRYFLEESPELRPIVEAMNRSPLAGRAPAGSLRVSGEIRPMDISPVIATDRAGRKAVFPMRWGFSGRTLLINARTETAAEKPAFREAWRAHRCIVPASYYFEWEHILQPDGTKKTGDKYMLRPEGEPLTFLCGLYRMEEGFPRFVILTREPAEEIRFIHDRMPLIMPAAYAGQWIRPDARPEELLARAAERMTFGVA